MSLIIGLLLILLVLGTIQTFTLPAGERWRRWKGPFRVFLVIGGSWIVYQAILHLPPRRDWASLALAIILPLVVTVALAQAASMHFMRTRTEGSESTISDIGSSASPLREHVLRGAGFIVFGRGATAVVGALVIGVRDGGALVGIMMAVGMLVALGLSGAAYGVTYHATEPIRARGRVAHLFANLIALLAYCLTIILLVVAGLVIYSGWR